MTTICYQCGKPATGFVNVTRDAASSVPSEFRPVCPEHGASGAFYPMSEVLLSILARYEADARSWRWHEEQRRYHRNEAIRRVNARGLKEGELQWRWRTGPPEKYDVTEVEEAILDALTREGITAWSGDGVSCVEQIVRKQAEIASELRQHARQIHDALDGRPLPSSCDQAAARVAGLLSRIKYLEGELDRIREGSQR